METNPAIAVVGTFDSKGEEHLFLKERIEARGLRALTMNVGTGGPSPFPPDIDFYTDFIVKNGLEDKGRDGMIQAVVSVASDKILALYGEGHINGIISAGGGTGTHLGTGIMRVLPMGIPKVMVSTVASRDMSGIVGTKDITMVHSVTDIMGVNSLLGGILDQAAAAVCAMAESNWQSAHKKKRIALTMFGFITRAAEQIKKNLEALGYEVVPFHANGTGGMAMEELAREGYFHGILDLATHELADQLRQGYCKGIGPLRLQPINNRKVPRLVVPGGLDCAVLEFTRENIPAALKERKIFFYDFRSAVRLDLEETRAIAQQLAGKLNQDPSGVKLLIPMDGWSEADKAGEPLHDPRMRDAFIEKLRKDLDPRVLVREVGGHINDPSFAQAASALMDEMLRNPG
ncbi:MAG: Tm-1-like ATP-binding domain-containing protein [Deltaproteobacteria bacterium]|nr:Tm-1-like ATP-binding domain-containing protein [Deltaproteobacteria bacterium]